MPAASVTRVFPITFSLTSKTATGLSPTGTPSEREKTMQLKPYIRLARFLDRLACLILRIGERLSLSLLTLRYNLQRSTHRSASALWSLAYDADSNFALRALMAGNDSRERQVNDILRRVHLPTNGEVDGKAVTR